MRESADAPRFLAVLVGMFGALAPGLAVVGIYGAMSYAVVQNSSEMGVRSW